MSLERIAATLLEGLDTSRVTIRLPPDYPVDAEALAPGVPSIGHTIAVQDSSTFTLLRTGDRPVVQDDVRVSPPAYPELIEIYGCYAQMLAAVLDEGEMVGLVAVHQLEEPRHWTEEEIAKLTSAAEGVRRELAKTG